MANSTTLQQIHLALKELSDGKKSLIPTKHLGEHVQLSPEKLVTLLSQLANLQYLKFTSGQDFIQLTETGLLAVPSHSEEAEEIRA